LKKIIFIIYITLFAQAEDYTSSIYRGESYSNSYRDGDRSFYEFQNDYDKALIQAKNENKYIFLLVTEEFCDWCEKLIDITFQDKKIVGMLEKKYIGVVVDRKKDYYPSNIGVSGVPSVFILDSKTGKIIKSIVGYRDKEYYMQVFEEIENSGIYQNR
jgi:thioredoxin-related protein